MKAIWYNAVTQPDDRRYCFKGKWVDERGGKKTRKTEREEDGILQRKRKLALPRSKVSLTVCVGPWQVRLMRTACPWPGIKEMPQISLSEPDGQKCQFVNKQKREKRLWGWKGKLPENMHVSWKRESKSCLLTFFTLQSLYVVSSFPQRFLWIFFIISGGV